MSKEFNSFSTACGIKNQCTMLYTPQQNGTVERKNRSLMEMARCIAKIKALSHPFWLEVVMCATYVLSKFP